MLIYPLQPEWAREAARVQAQAQASRLAQALRTGQVQRREQGPIQSLALALRKEALAAAWETARAAAR